jgi:ADP-ribosylglycohydrolase
MLPSYKVLRELLKKVIMDKEEQGYVTDELYDELKRIPDSYDAIDCFSKKLSKLKLREEWEYNEPYSLEKIWEECDPKRPLSRIGSFNSELFSEKTKIAFLSSVCGCILGKPLEEFPCPTYYEIKDSLMKAGQWPLKNYISEEVLEYFGRRHRSWNETIDENIAFVASDDDITYKLIAMMLLEKHGLDFTKDNIRKIWIDYLPIYTTWGPERNILIKAGIYSLAPEEKYDIDSWGDIFNPGEEQCGAMIRVDPYGYACAGNPALAAELAWRDASFTHRKTGIYGAMFAAAAISTAYVAKDRMEIFEIALKFVPQRSRFYKIASDSLDRIKKASDFEEGYNSVHKTYEDYGACRIFQEIGTLMNTMKFAENISDGICKQVIQGNDTDSFGAIAGSLLGAYFGEKCFDYRWIEKFNDNIYTTMGDFNERSLSKLANRMADLPELGKLQKGREQTTS